MTNLQREARTLSIYLIGEPPNEVAVRLYEQNVGRLVQPWTPSQEWVWRLCMRLPVLLPLIDSVLGLVNRYGAVRHRIFLMNCVLEAQPQFSRHYLPR